MIKYQFTEGAIDPRQISQEISSFPNNNTGALSIFLGQVRADVVNHKTVEAIEYTSYKTMADDVLHKLTAETSEKFDLHTIIVLHSTGIVPAGKLCLFVLTAAAHRHDAINACNNLVERIKAELPIWGKEIFNDQKFEWKENR